MTKLLLLKISTVLGLIPALVGMFYIFPMWIGLALDEVGSERIYLLVIFFSMYLLVLPYLYSLYLTFRLLMNIEQGIYYSKLSISYLSHIGISGYVIGTILLFDLPFVYGFANEEDAPGIIVVFGLFMGLAFVIGLFAKVLKDLNEDKA
jgi:hypothetical protein